MITTTIYDEDVEWVFSGAASFNAADNSNPHTGLIDLKATASLSGDTGQFKSPTVLNSSTFTNLSLWIEKSGIWSAVTSGVGIWWANASGNIVGNVVTIKDGAYGFSIANAAYQNVVIPAGDFGIPAGTQVQFLVFDTVTKTSLNYFLDTIVLTAVKISCNPSDVANAAICFEQCIPDNNAVRSLLLSQFVPCTPTGGGTTPIIGCNSPAAPNNLAASNVTSSGFTVTWSQPAGANVSQYQIIWSQSQLFTPAKRSGSAMVSGSTLTFNITGLQAGTTYFVEVIALNGLCPSQPSAILSQTTSGSFVTLPQLGSLILELESLDFDGTANGTQLTSWTDHSVGNHTFNLVGAALNANPAQPTVDGATLLNGHKTIRFDGTMGIGIANFVYGNTGQDLIIVYKPDEPIPAGDVLEGLMRIDQATNNAQPFTDNHFYCGFGRTDRPNIGQPVTALTSFVAFEQSSKSDNSSWDAYINTEHFFNSAVYTYNNINHANQTTLGVGYTGVINQFLTGNIAAVYCWNTVLSAADQLQARAYIKQTWGNGFGF